MNTPLPLSPQEPGLTPSNSTNASLIGGALASLIIFFLGYKGMHLPAGLEAAVATLATAAAGYLPRSGRQ